MKLREDIFLAASGSTGLSLTHSLDCNSYILRKGVTTVLIDTGAGYEVERIETEMKEDGIDPSSIDAVLLTHCHADHCGNAFYFHENYGLPVFAPDVEAQALETRNTQLLGLEAAKKAGYYPADYELAPCPIDKKIIPGERLTVGEITFQTFSAAGHSPLGICYLCDIGGRRVLLCGDLLDGEGKASVQVIPGTDVNRYAENVRALGDLDVDILLPGHRCMCLSEGSALLRKAAESFDHLMIPV